VSRISENVEASTSHNPKGLHGFYKDNFTFFIYLSHSPVTEVVTSVRSLYITLILLTKFILLTVIIKSFNKACNDIKDFFQFNDIYNDVNTLFRPLVLFIPCIFYCLVNRRLVHSLLLSAFTSSLLL
jgi:hypothetical protein